MLALLLVLVGAGPARAGACCVGSTSTVPTRLGECETMLGGLSLGAETSLGRWDGTGRLAPSSLQDDALLSSLAGAWRWDRKGQLSMSLPLRLNHKGLEGEHLWGGGAGDLVATVLWDPFIEVPRGGLGRASPVPILTAGLRLPTGRTWEQAEGLLLEDVTGRPGPGLLMGLSIERSLDASPWSLGVDSELAYDHGHLHPVLTFNGSLGRYLGTRWSLVGLARHERSWAMDGSGGSASRTVLGGKLARGEPLDWRGWLGVEGDLPIPELGHSNLRQVSASIGLALVR